MFQYTTIPDNDYFRKLGYLRGKAVDFLIKQIIDQFLRHEERILASEFSKPLIECCDENAKYIVTTAKLVAQERVFINERKLQIEIEAYSIVDRLLRAFCEAYIEARERRS